MHTLRARLHLPLIALAAALLLGLGLVASLRSAHAWDEENLNYFDPLDHSPLAVRPTYTPTVSSVHFDLVGALAIAAGFSVEDAALIQAYSQATDSGPLPGANPVYTFDADPNNYPTPPPLSQVITSTHCPSPTTIAPTVTFGLTTTAMECPDCFTSRYGPYGVFFHMPHDRPEELGAIRAWAFGQTPDLSGIVTFGYSSTATSAWHMLTNIYSSTACFASQTVVVDTGSIGAGSLPAFGIYLHSLGDSWSHRDCLAAVDALGLPFGAHVVPKGPDDPLWPCRWTMHSAEFGDPEAFPDSNRTFSGTLALYQALIEFAEQSRRPVFRPIPVQAENGAVFDALYEFAHSATDANPMLRRRLADQLYQWALVTRASKPEYWPRLYLPILTRA